MTSSAVKSNVTWRRRYVTFYTSNASNSRDFYPVLGEITCEIRIVSQVKHMDILILVCKKEFSSTAWNSTNPVSYVKKISQDTNMIGLNIFYLNKV